MTKPVYIKGIRLGEGIPRICVPVVGENRAEILEQAREAVRAGADLVEWRMDYWKEEDKKKYLEEILFALDSILSDKPLLFTIRTCREGGLFSESDEEYEILCMIAAASGKADLVDVEVFSSPKGRVELVQKLRSRGVRVAASSHDCQKTDSQEELISRLRKMDRTGADILKLAVMAQGFEDAARLMKAVSLMREETDKPLIAMAMGEHGMITRIAGEDYGSCVSFGTVGNPSAPGQLPAGELRSLMEALHRKKI